MDRQQESVVTSFFLYGEPPRAERLAPHREHRAERRQRRVPDDAARVDVDVDGDRRAAAEGDLGRRPAVVAVRRGQRRR